MLFQCWMHIACDWVCSGYMYKPQLVNRKNRSESISRNVFSCFLWFAVKFYLFIIKCIDVPNAKPILSHVSAEMLLLLFPGSESTEVFLFSMKDNV